MSDILVFGASGFIGRAIIEQLQKKTLRARSRRRAACCGSGDPGLIDDLLRTQPPGAIIQASGLTHHRGQGFHELYEGNVMPTIRLASALERIGRRDVPVYVLGSAAELGRTDHPAAETDACQPHTDYGRSKWFQTLFALAKNRDGFRFNVLRLFNVVGPGMNPMQVPRCFVDAIVRGDAVLQDRRARLRTRLFDGGDGGRARSPRLRPVAGRAVWLMSAPAAARRRAPSSRKSSARPDEP